MVFAAAAGYFATNPTTVVSTQVVTSTLPGAVSTVTSTQPGGVSTVTSTQPGSVTTSTQLSTVTNVVTQTATSTAAPLTVRLAYKLGVGFYMTNATGWTLYARASDSQTNVASTCAGACIANWPAFYAASVNAPTGLNSSGFTTVTRTDGVKQLAYNGWPLYYFSKDKAPGDTTGQGVAGVWFVCCNLAAATTTSTTSTSTTTTTTSTTTTGTGGTVQVSIASGAGANQASPGYSPSTVTLVRGVNTTIKWTNNDSSSHTVTSISVPAGAQSFASGNMISGATFTFTFTAPGTYTYICEYHSWMMGTVVVK